MAFSMGLSLFLCLLPLLQAADHYEILIPQIVRPGQEFSFSFSTFTAGSSTFKPEVGIRNTRGDVIVNKKPNLLTDRTYALSLTVPGDLADSTYEFYAVCDKVFVVNDSRRVTINKKVHSLFVQTDKGLYKPGQKVLFRVVAITPDLKAYKDEIDITIYDTAQNKIKELKAQKSDKGVITSYLQLSDPTPLGQWKIKAETKFAVVEQFFTVAEYVLPKFEVSVGLPSFYHVNLDNPSHQEDLRATVVATYTYGKPVDGLAQVVIKLDYQYWWYSEPQPIIKKSLELKNGKADIVVTFNEIKKLLPSSWTVESLKYQTISVAADVTETLTGIILSGQSKVPCKPFLYSLEFAPSTANNFKPGLNYEAYLRVLRSDGTQPDKCELVTSDFKLKTVTVEITFQYPWDWKNPIPSNTTKTVLTLNEQGIVFLQFKTDAKVDSVNLKATYLDEVSSATVYAYYYLNKFETRDQEGIQLNLLNKDTIIKPGVRLTFEIRSLTPIKRYDLHIVSKGSIVYTSYYTTPTESIVFYKNILMSQTLVGKVAPEARFVVSYVTRSGELVADSLALNVIDYMANKITLSFNKNVTQPGDGSVVLDVKTGGDSFVGLLGVDQSVLLLNKGNDLSQNLIANELASYNDIYYDSSRPMPMGIRCFDCDFWPIWLGGSNTDNLLSNAGLFVLTDLFVKKNEYFPIYYMMDDAPMMAMDMAVAPMAREEEVEMDLGSEPSSPSGVKVRKDFPETFIWTDTVTDGSGVSRISLTVPDTITTWVATGFSVSPSNGLGVTQNAAKLGVIKPLFISLNLPYSIIRGEEFVLQANIFNYYGQNLLAEVKLLASKYFKVIDCATKELNSTEIKKMVEVNDNTGTPVFFWIVATTLGHIPIELRAFTGNLADAIKATLLVKPEGQPQSYTTSELIQLKTGEVFDSSLKVELPPEKILVPGSVKVEVTLIGDIIGSALNDIENLLKMPYGCGEQNLLSFAPDVFILKYLKASARLTDAIKSKAIDFLISGYQRQLTFQRNDGSFSAFGQSDQAGSTWLSAFTIKCFRQADDFISIEDDKIAKTLAWIIRYQTANGTFVEPPGGRVIHTNMQGGASSGIAMTAFVLIALNENKNNSVVGQSILKASIEKATLYLEASYLKYSDDPYALAIIARALFTSNSLVLPKVLSLLEKLAVNEGGMKHWKGKAETPSDTWKSIYGQPSSYEVELASYVLLVYAEQKSLDQSLPIAKWLLTQRNAFGGFSSTQDTVLGLEALAAFAVLIAAPTEGSGISVSVKNDFDGKTHKFDPISQDNALILQSLQLPEETRLVSVSAEEAGVALVQLIVTYNVDAGDNNDVLKLKLSTAAAEKNLTLDISTSWSGAEVSGMVVVEVNLLTGYAVVAEGSIKDQIGRTFKKLEKTASKIVVYLDELTEEELQFRVSFEEVIPVTNVKPALVKVYRYYATEYVASGFYSSTNDVTWEGACPLCC